MLTGNIAHWLSAKQIRYERNHPLKHHTTYQVGGRAALAVFPDTLRELIMTTAFCRRLGINPFILGGGANVIVSDDGLPGITILTGRLNRLRLAGGFVEAECGVTLEQLAVFAADHGLAGFSFLYDIPGSIGGSLIMNAGNNHGEMSHICDRTTVLERDNRVRTYPAVLAEFGYRTSRFRQDGSLILSARFRPRARSRTCTLHHLNEQIRRERWSKFPMEFPNGGSVFKRPSGDYAGRLIEVCGCGGMRVGDAELSRKHHGFIVNLGNATATDVRALIGQIQDKVHQQTGVLLEREQIYLPEDVNTQDH